MNLPNAPMTQPDDSLYQNPKYYDVYMGAFAEGECLAFYERMVARYGQPVLELACGTGRVLIPLAEGGARITGLDLSPRMLAHAKTKAAARGVKINVLQGDMRRFRLRRKFKLIFVAAQSLAHLYTWRELEQCLASVRRHLAVGGRFVIEIFNPSLTQLARDPEKSFLRGEYGSGPNKFTTISRSHYDAAAQINHYQYLIVHPDQKKATKLTFSQRQHFPQEMDALLAYNGFVVEHKYGDYPDRPFTSDSPKQLIVCRLADAR
jgi:SAM-dependent methyltransferase